MYGELDRVPLEIKRKCAIIKYWLGIVSNWNTLAASLKEAYSMHIQTKSCSEWLSFIKQTLSNLGFSNVWINPASVSQGLFLDELEQRLSDSLFSHGI